MQTIAVALETFPVRPLTMLETVMALTPARSATSRRVVMGVLVAQSACRTLADRPQATEL